MLNEGQTTSQSVIFCFLIIGQSIFISDDTTFCWCVQMCITYTDREMVRCFINNIHKTTVDKHVNMKKLNETYEGHIDENLASRVFSFTEGQVTYHAAGTDI